MEDEIIQSEKQMEESEEAKEYTVDPADEDENLFELEIKNLDTNEVFKMHIPIGSGDIEKGDKSNRMMDPNYASKRKMPEVAGMLSSLSAVEGIPSMGQ